MFRFADPLAFLLLVPLGAAAWWVYRRRIRSGLLFAPLYRIPSQGATWQGILRLVCPAVFLIGLAGAVAALSRPQKVLSRIERQADAIAIAMVVDMSGSMQALDFSTRDRDRSRLDVVKETFAEFVKRRPNDLIGLVTFGGYAATRVPLTLDHHALLQTLKGVEIPKSSYDDRGRLLNAEELLTAIGDGLATACARLQSADVKSKIVVLLSDGESNTGLIKPEEAMRAARALGIRVYTIGVGSTGRAPFVVKDVFGRNVIQYVDVRLDEELLRNIARTTHGRYFNVRDPNGLRQAMEDIDKLERTPVRRQLYEQHRELFAWFLFPSLLLILAAATGHVLAAKAIV